MDAHAFIIPAFIAGILTFLAPCTLPLVPGYLSFISGATIADLRDPEKARKARLKVFLNGLFYVIGFSAVFILLGSLFGLGGAVFFQYRNIVVSIGGIFVILFGIFLLAPAIALLTSQRINLLGVLPFSLLLGERQIGLARGLKPGTPVSSLAFGGTFALGWSPCVGPILGSILTLAASSATLTQGAFLLSVFSAGLAVPFLAVALGIGWASKHFSKMGKYLNWVSVVGGFFLIFLGIVMVTNNFASWIAWMYQTFDFIDYDALLDYL